MSNDRIVKLLACRSAEWVTRQTVQLHGGTGYAEESTVSRLFVDARVSSIFEGAEETLAVKVSGRALLDGVFDQLFSTWQNNQYVHLWQRFN